MPASIDGAARGERRPPLDGNAGITALGVSDAASGAWDRVDVFVDAAGDRRSRRRAAGDVQMTLDGQPVPASPSRAGRDARRSTASSCSDLPAAGGLLTRAARPARIALAARQHGERATAEQADREGAAVAVARRAMLGPVLDADRRRHARDDNAGRRHSPRRREPSAAMRPRSSSCRPPRSRRRSCSRIRTAFDSTRRPHRRRRRTSACTQIDAMCAGADVRAGRSKSRSATGTQWRFSVWEELLSEHYNFTRSRAFPLFVANALRWLAGTPAWYPYGRRRPARSSPASAGERRARVDASGRVDRSARRRRSCRRAPANCALAAATRTLSVSLLDPDVTTRRARRAHWMSRSIRRAVDLAPRPASLTWLLLLAARAARVRVVLVPAGPDAVGTRDDDQPSASALSSAAAGHRAAVVPAAPRAAIACSWCCATLRVSGAGAGAGAAGAADRRRNTRITCSSSISPPASARARACSSTRRCCKLRGARGGRDVTSLVVIGEPDWRGRPGAARSRRGSARSIDVSDPQQFVVARRRRWPRRRARCRTARAASFICSPTACRPIAAGRRTCSSSSSAASRSTRTTSASTNATSIRRA